MIEFIATGDRSDYVVSTMRDLEACARTEKDEIEHLIEESKKPVQLPSMGELAALATNLEACMLADVERGRAMLRRWLEGGIIKCATGPRVLTRPAISSR